MRTRLISPMIGLAMIVFVVASFYVAVPLRPSKVTQENFDRLRDSMSEDEVESILGPPGYYHSRHYVVLEHGIAFRRYWLGDEGVIIIEAWDVDPTGPARVTSKKFFPVPRQTYGERWLQSLGP